MILTEAGITGAFIVDPERREDARGFFARVWSAEEFAAHGLNASIFQCNISYNSRRGTIRGLHLQLPPFQEAKHVRCTRGAVYDVIADLRPDSSTYLRWIGVELTEENRRALYIPEGCAHGYQTLSDSSEVTYSVSTAHNPAAEAGVRYDDPLFRIAWPLEATTVSDKDRRWPDFVSDRGLARAVGP